MTVDGPISIVHGHARVSLFRVRLQYYAAMCNRTAIFRNDIPALLTSKNFYHSGVSVKIKPHTIIAWRNVPTTKLNTSNTRNEFSRYYYLLLCHWPIVLANCSMPISCIDVQRRKMRKYLIFVIFDRGIWVIKVNLSFNQKILLIVCFSNCKMKFIIINLVTLNFALTECVI